MFALVDCNNFFASCELVFNPLLDKKPLVILSNNDGCIIARSQKAKQIGIKMGDPAFLYRDQAARGEIGMISSNFALYADMSRRVMEVLSSFSPDMELYSIDEAFFLLDDAPDEILVKQAVAMRGKIKQWTGIPVSIGMAPTKTLAKIANEMAKKELGGVCILSEPAAIQSHLAKTALIDVWGVGRRTAEQLKRKGIYTAAQLTEADDAWIRKLLGVTGLQTVLELRGIPCLQILEEEEKKKSILCSRSFPSQIGDLVLLQEAVASFTSHAAEKLRAQKSLAGFLSVFLSPPLSEKTDSYNCHIQLPNPTSYTPELIALAREGIAQLFRPGLFYKRAGVLLGDFSDEDHVQNDLMAPNDFSPQKTEAMKILDQINARYDKAAIRFAAQGKKGKRPWQSSRSNVSPNFTTNWNDLLKVK